MNSPTDRLSLPQRALLNAIAAFYRKHGYGPSFRDLQDLCGMSTTSLVAYHLRKLRKLLYITFDDGRARTIRLTSKAALREVK